MKINGKKNSTTQMIPEAKVNQNRLGQIRYWIRIPSGVIVEVGMSLAMLNAGPNKHSCSLIKNCLLPNCEVFLQRQISSCVC